MKILALSDIHSDRGFMRKMAQKGKDEKVDLVIIAGDLFNFDQHKPGLIAPFKKAGLEVAIIPGNHEGIAEVKAMCETYELIDLHGKAIRRGDVGIFGCGYGDIGLHQYTDKEFFDVLEKAHEKVKDAPKKLMVTHVEPNDCVISMMMPGWGSTGVRKAINKFKPHTHICGHIHETHGLEEKIGSTRVINVGKTGKIIEL